MSDGIGINGISPFTNRPCRAEPRRVTLRCGKGVNTKGVAMRWFLAVLFIGWTMALASAQAIKGKTPPKQLSSDAVRLAGKTFDEWVKEISNKDPSKSATAISAIPAFPAATAI